MARSGGGRIGNHRGCPVCQTGVICKELERELAKCNASQQSKRAIAHIGIENLAIADTSENKEEQLETLADKLRKYALPPIYVDVIIYVCVHNWNFSEIAEALNIVSWQRARTIYNQGIELLRERGYR